MAVETFKTPIGRACFVHAFEPTTNENDEERYSIMLVFPKDTDLTFVRQKVKKAIKEKFAGKKLPSNFRSDPFRDTEEKEHLGAPFDKECAGGVFMTAVSKYRPEVVDRNVNELMDRDDFDSGDYARVAVNLFFYNKKGNQGVSFGLQNIQKAKGGTRLAGGRSAKEDFDNLEDEEGIEDDEDESILD